MASPSITTNIFIQFTDLFDGKRTITEIIKAIKAHYNLDLNPEIFIEILKTLNDNCYLETPNYYFIKFQADYYLSLPESGLISFWN